MNKRTLSANAEIDLIDILFDMLCMWRPIVAVMLVCGILVTGFMYVRTGKQAEAIREQIAQIELEKEEVLKDADAEAEEGAPRRIDEVRAELSGAELQSVDFAVEQYAYMKRMNDYYNNSVYYQLDKDSVATLSVDIFSTDNSDMAYYYASSKADDMVKRIREYLTAAYETDNKYMDGMISSSTSTVFRDEDYRVSPVIFNISILFDKKISEAELRAEVKKAAVRAFNGRNYNTIFSVNTDNNVNVIKDQFNAVKDMNSLKSDVRKAVDGFSDDQKRVFRYLTIGTSVGVDKFLGADPDVEEVPDETETEDLVEVEELIIPEYTSRDMVKYFVLGAVLGIFMFGFVLFAKAAIFYRVKSPDVVCEVYGIKNYGQVREYPYKSAFARFCYSKAVYNLRYRQGKDAMLSELARYIEFDHADKKPVIFTMGNVLSEVQKLGGSMVEITNLSRSACLKAINECKDEAVVLAIESGKVSAKVIDEVISCFAEEERMPYGIVVTEG